MELTHPLADGITRPARSVRRAVRLLAFVLVAAAAIGGFGARAALAGTPATVTLSVTPSSVGIGGVVTMTATVTSTRGTPTGHVSIQSTSASQNTFDSGLQVLNPTSSDPNTYSFTLTTSALPTGLYVIGATYVPDFTASELIGIDGASSLPQALQVGTTTMKHLTQVTVTTPSLTFTVGENVTLTASVSNGIGNGVPTGTVTFTDVAHGSIPLAGGAAFPLASDGTVQLDVRDFLVGAHDIIASYSGDSANAASSLDPPLHLTALAPSNPTVQTITNVTVSPTATAAGDPVTITATVVQLTPTGTIHPTGGGVSFTATLSGSIPVYIGSAALGTGQADNQAVLLTHIVDSGDYTITASYFGNIFVLDTPGTATISVLPPRANTTIAYTGDDEAVFGHTAHLSATIKDREGVLLPNRSVTFSLGTSSCPATTDANGNATCSIAVTADPGSHTGFVQVTQDLQTAGVSASFAFTIKAAPTSISAAFQPGLVNTTLRATLLTEGVPLANRTVSFSLDGEICAAATDAAGIATCSVLTIVGPPPTATLAAVYAGSTDYSSSVDSHSVQLLVTTTLVYTGVTDGVYHGATTLSAKLTDGSGHAVVDRALTFTLGTATFGATTDASGVGSVPIPSLMQDPAPLALTVSYGGDVVSAPSTASATFTIAKAPTTLTATLPAVGATTTLTATLTETASGAPIVGRTVALSLGTASCLHPVTTAANGVATCPVTAPTGSAATLTATFGGDIDYLNSSDSKSVTLLKPTAAIYTGPGNGEYNDVVVLSGTLTDTLSNRPLAGQPVTFTLGSQTCTPSSSTDAAGTASCRLLLAQPANSYTVKMSYPGSGTYDTSSVTTPFEIKHEDTSFAPLPAALVNGPRITLSATLLEDNLIPLFPLVPLAPRAVTLTLGSGSSAISCDGTPDSSGTVTCTVPSAPSLGLSTLTARFSGNAFYAPTSLTRTVAIGAFPDGGTFVIGDRDNGSVNFWGSQWSKNNHLSRGDAPPSFKGWAQGTFTASWNGNWSTDPGNSSPPPVAPLPPYMAVIQTGMTSKSGSRIFGDTVHIVIVKTAVGYAPNAGHDGTGTVVATVR